MIILQILSAILLIPLSIVMLILANIYIVHRAYFLFELSIALIYSILCGILFVSIKAIVIAFIMLMILYMIRTRYLFNRFNKEEKKMSNERKLILEMLKSGKITVDEAEKLLESAVDMHEEVQAAKSINKKFLRIFVIDGESTKVNINIPIALAEIGLKLIPKDTLNVQGREIKPDEILKLIQEGNEGELVNIDTMEKGRQVKVKIYIA